MSRRPLRIGLSARIYHPQPGATGLQSKSLQYLEQSVAHWVMSREVMVFMIPSVSGDGIVHRSSIRLSDYTQFLDGLVLQGAHNATVNRRCMRTGQATACAMPMRWNCCMNAWKLADQCLASAGALNSSMSRWAALCTRTLPPNMISRKFMRTRITTSTSTPSPGRLAAA